MPRNIASLAAALLLASLASAGELPRPRAWVRIADVPYAIVQSSAAYDAARDRVVLYGGGNMTCGTWEFDGQSWACTPINFELVIEPRLVFDETRSRVVTVGGQAQESRTREWTGANWPVIASTGPEARTSFMLVWDSDRQRAVLFGGRGQQTPFPFPGSTWEWSGTSWSSLPGGPPGRTDCAGAYDASRARTVLYGGRNSTQLFDDTWEWNGVTWTQIPASPPPQRVNAGMIYSPLRARSLIHGGMLSKQQTYSNETWSWDGVAWRREIERGPLSFWAVMCYDSLRHRTIMLNYGVGNDSGTWALPDCPGDANADGAVNFADLNAVLSNFGQPIPLGIPGDLDGDGLVTFTDLNHVLSSFGATGC